MTSTPAAVLTNPDVISTGAPAIPARGDGTQTWATPWHIVRAVERDSFGGVPFALDCCAQPHTAKTSKFYALERGDNGLVDTWLDATWQNPPYGEQDKWLARAAYFASIGINVACLVLASTSSLYWRPLTFDRGEVHFYEGRIAFLDETNTPVKGASFSSALVLLGPRFKPGVVRIRSAETGEIIGGPMRVTPDLFTGGSR